MYTYGCANTHTNIRNIYNGNPFGVKFITREERIQLCAKTLICIFHMNVRVFATIAEQLLRLYVTACARICIANLNKAPQEQQTLSDMNLLTIQFNSVLKINRHRFGSLSLCYQNSVEPDLQLSNIL